MLSTTLQSTGISSQTARFLAPAIALLALAMPLTSQAADKPFLPPPSATVSTVPANGDVNPYGTAFVALPSHDDQSKSELPANSVLQPGDLLVSNFNNVQNLQGTGTTIVRIDANGTPSLFFTSSYPGLTGALGILSDGVVIVGNLKTADGTPATASAGVLQIISPAGLLLGVINNVALIDGPWGLAIHEYDKRVDVFVSNVLNGTITRLTFERTVARGLVQKKAVVIATGLTHRSDPGALELGPSGLLYDRWTDTLYFASSTDNAIYTISKASTVGAGDARPVLLVQNLTNLHGPLDLAFVPNGDLLVANSDGSNASPTQPSEIDEYTKAGAFVTQFSIDPNDGGAFGIVTQRLGDQATRLAAVDDNAANVTIYTKIDR